MDCSVLLGEQLEALRELADGLLDGPSDPTRLLNCRELKDRAAAHCQVREKVVLPVLRQRGWSDANSEAMAAHLELKRTLAALCICAPGEDDFAHALQQFAAALERQRQADAQWLVPALRLLTTVDERRLVCEQVEQWQEALVPPPEHYLATAPLPDRPGAALLADAALVLKSLGDAR